MPDVTVDDDLLTVTLSHREHLLTLTGSFEVPVADVVGAEQFDDSQSLPWFRLGTHFPGVFRAGRFRGDGKRYFIFHRKGRPAIDVQLEGDGFDRLIIDVPDPEALLEQLRTPKSPTR